MEPIPDDMILQIAQFLGLVDLGRFMQCNCIIFRKIARSGLWQKFVRYGPDRLDQFICDMENVFGYVSLDETRMAEYDETYMIVRIIQFFEIGWHNWYEFANRMVRSDANLKGAYYCKLGREKLKQTCQSALFNHSEIMKKLTFRGTDVTNIRYQETTIKFNGASDDKLLGVISKYRINDNVVWIVEDLEGLGSSIPGNDYHVCTQILQFVKFVSFEMMWGPYDRSCLEMKNRD